MALIYSSAVNKRINSVQRSKRSTVESPHQSIQEVYHCKHRSHDETSKRQPNDGFHPMARSISLGKEISCNRKRSISQSGDKQNGHIPSGSGSGMSRKESTCSSHSKTSQSKEKLLRSKTSIGEMKRKYTVGSDVRKNSRKISTPVMSQSVITDHEGCSSCSKSQQINHEELRKALAKKCLIQSQELDEDEPSSSHSGSPENFEQGAYLIRMKSTSLDEEDWKRRVEGAQMLGLRTAPDPKVGAIQRMRNKLCKWKLAIADTRS
uniref:Uncharacterized protein n=1 Tax=Acrobeloides nanus TaxID=290746 RepID=A0A914CC76_9BILA